MVPFEAIWDTGATHSAITQAVIDACGLGPTGITKVRHVAGEKLVETYLVNIGLPNNVAVYNVRATKAELTPGSDILIGMDIMSRGDFAVTNFGGTTKFSFRVPSVEHIDFVKEGQRLQRLQFQHGGKPNPKRPNLSGRTKGKQKKRKRNR